MEDESAWLMSNNISNAPSVPSFLNYVYVDGIASVDTNSANLIGYGMR